MSVEFERLQEAVAHEWALRLNEMDSLTRKLVIFGQVEVQKRLTDQMLYGRTFIGSDGLRVDPGSIEPLT